MSSVVSWIMIFSSGYVSDYFIKRGLTITSTRRICNSIGFWGSASMLLGLCIFTPDQRSWSIVLLLINSALLAWAHCGYGVNLYDISPHYASITMTISETLGTTFSVVSSLTWGLIVSDRVNIFLNIFFIVFKIKILVPLIKDEIISYNLYV